MSGTEPHCTLGKRSWKSLSTVTAMGLRREFQEGSPGRWWDLKFANAYRFPLEYFFRPSMSYHISMVIAKVPKDTQQLVHACCGCHCTAHTGQEDTSVGKNSFWTAWWLDTSPQKPSKDLIVVAHTSNASTPMTGWEAEKREQDRNLNIPLAVPLSFLLLW